MIFNAFTNFSKGEISKEKHATLKRKQLQNQTRLLLIHKTTNQNK